MDQKTESGNFVSSEESSSHE